MMNQDNNNRRLFLPPILPHPSFNRSGRSATYQGDIMKSGPQLTLKTIGSTIGTAKTAWDSIPDEVKQSAKTVASNFVKDRVPPSASGSGDSGHSSGYVLSKAPNPKVTKLDTGIKPNTYTNDYLDTMENVCSPLHMSAAIVRIPTTVSSELFEYFNDVIAFDLQTNAQANVTFNLNVNTVFTAANILTAFNSLLNALQIYFYYTSILTYHNASGNNNTGMLYLRRQITPDMMNSIVLLGRRLSDTPCPPRMLELVRYLMTNYFTSENQGSPMIKICPHPAYATMVSALEITSALDAMDISTTKEVFTLMRRAVPHWKIGTLYDVPVLPVYDSNFLTIFANLPFAYWTGVANYVPTVANSDATISYNSFTNALDGMAFALTTVYDTAAAGFNPGLITLPAASGTTNGHTRKSYYEVGGVKAFYPVAGYPFLVRSRQETYCNDSTTTVMSVHLSGADRCLNVNANSIYQTAKNSLDYLMTWDSVAKRAGAFGQENKDAPKPRKYRK